MAYTPTQRRCAKCHRLLIGVPKVVTLCWDCLHAAKFSGVKTTFENCYNCNYLLKNTEIACPQCGVAKDQKRAAERQILANSAILKLQQAVELAKKDPIGNDRGYREVKHKITVYLKRHGLKREWMTGRLPKEQWFSKKCKRRRCSFSWTVRNRKTAAMEYCGTTCQRIDWTQQEIRRTASKS